MGNMNKEELLKLIKSLDIDNEEFWILSSGALVLREIWPGASDLDIAVTNKGLNQLKQKYQLTQKENGWFMVSEKIECVCDGGKENLEYQPEVINGIQVQNINEYLDYLRKSERQKDKDRIDLVEDYIKNMKK